MEKVNERRQFVRGIGFFAALVGGGVAAATTANGTIMGTGNVENISHLAPPENATLVEITGAYGEKPKPQAVNSLASSTYYINGLNLETTHKASMAVGMDNRLWVKVGNQWKRVVLEG